MQMLDLERHIHAPHRKYNRVQNAVAPKNWRCREGVTNEWLGSFLSGYLRQRKERVSNALESDGAKFSVADSP